MKNKSLSFILPIALLVLSAAIVNACIDEWDCLKCEKCQDGVCVYQDVEEDLKDDCITAYTCYNQMFISRNNVGYCDGWGDCSGYANYPVSNGNVCIGGIDSPPTAEVNCGVWNDCIEGYTSAGQFYVGYSCTPGDCDGSCSDANWQPAGTTWLTDPGFVISLTEHAPACSQASSSCTKGSTMACGEGICAGTKRCRSDGTWGDCSTAGLDAGICAKCSSDGTPVYASGQSSDCEPTICPADVCGGSSCGTNIWANYPLSVSNQCSAIYTCTQNSCEGKATCQADADGDSFSAKCGDCNDNNPSMFPGAEELCDGKDNNCNGQADENIASIACGTGVCAGISTCTRGTWGRCSTAGLDAGICAKCSSDGTPVYASGQSSDCEPTICPADGCGLDTCTGLHMWANYPTSVANRCSAIYTCTQNTCDGKAVCKLAPKKCP